MKAIRSILLLALLIGTALGPVACIETGTQAPSLEGGGSGRPERLGGTGEGFGGMPGPLPIAGVYPIYTAQVNGAGMAVSGGEESFPLLGTDDFTVGFLMKADVQYDSGAAINVIVGKLDEGGLLEGSSYPFLCGILNHTAGAALRGRVQCLRRAAEGAEPDALTTPFALNDGRAHHIFFSKRGTELSMMIDGVRTVSLILPVSSRASAVNNIPIQFGGIDSVLTFAGKLNIIAVYSRAFTDAELQGFYNARFPKR